MNSTPDVFSLVRISQQCSTKSHRGTYGCFFPFCLFISRVACLFSSVSNKRLLHRDAWWKHRMLDPSCAYLVTCFLVFTGQTRSYRKGVKVISILVRTTAYQFHEKIPLGKEYPHWLQPHPASTPPCPCPSEDDSVCTLLGSLGSYFSNVVFQRPIQPFLGGGGTNKQTDKRNFSCSSPVEMQLFYGACSQNVGNAPSGHLWVLPMLYSEFLTAC